MSMSISNPDFKTAFKKSVKITIVLIVLMVVSIFLISAMTELGVTSTYIMYIELAEKILIYALLGVLFKVNYIDMVFKKAKFKIIILSVLIGISYILLELCMNQFIIKYLPNESLYDLISNHIPLCNLSVTDARISVFIYTLIIAPLFEELIFRGYILDKLLRASNNKYMPILISSILFGIYHLSLGSGLNAFIFGIVSSLIYIRYKNIRYNIAIHRTINVITFLAILIH